MKTKVVVLHHGDDALRNDPLIQNACNVRDEISTSLIAGGYNIVPVLLDDDKQWIGKIEEINPQLIFNAADLGFYRDNFFEPLVPSVLEMLRIPYTGSNTYAMCFSSDKLTSKRYLNQFEVPVPRCFLADEIISPLPFTGILKYRNLHNSEGIAADSIVRNMTDFTKKVQQLKAHHPDDVIMEEFIEGCELCSGFVGNGDTIEFLPVIQIDSGFAGADENAIRDFSTKWHGGHDEVKKIPNLAPELINRIQLYTKIVAGTFALRDYARMDFRLRKEGDRMVPYLVDINANPDLGFDGSLRVMAEFAGMSQEQMILKVAAAALKRSK